MNNEWFAISISLVASAFFSGMEIAFLTSNKLRIELESKQGDMNAKIYSYFLKKQSYFLATMLLANCVALVVFSIYMSNLLEPFFSRFISNEILITTLQTIISTLIILVSAEFIPKNLFRINPNGVMRFFAIPVFIIYCLLFPIVFATILISDFILKIFFRIDPKEKKDTLFGKIDLDNLVRESTTRISEKEELEHEVKIFQNALDFSELKARECMIPRTEIIAVNVNEHIDVLKKKFMETKLSKIIIYENNIDHIIGYTHSFELFKKPDSIRSILLPVLIVPESKPASEVLTLFIQQHKSVALVVDEFGGTSGMLTMEDIIEEIIGEIEDEHDKDELIDKQLSEKEFIFSGRIEIDFINHKYNLNLPIIEGFETLAGFILNNYQSLPTVNEVIRINRFVFKILQVSSTRIELVNLKIED